MTLLGWCIGRFVPSGRSLKVTLVNAGCVEGQEDHGYRMWKAWCWVVAEKTDDKSAHSEQTDALFYLESCLVLIWNHLKLACR